MISFPLSCSLSMTPSPSWGEGAACKSISTACTGLSLPKPRCSADPVLPLLPLCRILSAFQLWQRLLVPLQTSNTFSTLGHCKAWRTPHGTRHRGAFTGVMWRVEPGPCFSLRGCPMINRNRSEEFKANGGVLRDICRREMYSEGGPCPLCIPQSLLIKS